MINLPSIIARQVVASYSQSLKRTEPSRIEIDVAKAAMRHLLRALAYREDAARKKARMSAHINSDTSDSLNYFAEQVKEFRDEFNNLIN